MESRSAGVRAGVLTCLLGLAAVVPALAQSRPVQTPQLRIETGMHTSAVKRISVDRACALLVSGSDDKTARLWRLPQDAGRPQLLRTFRVPIGDGDVGKVYAVAIDPDGRTVAVGGWTREGDDWVYLFDAAGGNILTRLGPTKNVVNHLAFSGDGRYLSAALGGGAGVMAWERQGLAEWRRVLLDNDFDGKDSYGVAFAPDGRLFAVGDDGTLRRYGRSFKREAKVSTTAGREPYSVAVHPDGKTLAVGIDDKVAVELYDADTLRLVYSIDTAGIVDGNISSVAWSKDGERLYGAGTHSNDDKQHPVFIWSNRGRGRHTSSVISRDTIRQLETCGDRIAVASTEPGLGLIEANGKQSAWITGVAPEMRGKKGPSFTVSRDGTKVRFGLANGDREPVLFDLAAGRMSPAPDPLTDLAPARIEGLDIKDWENDRAPKLRGKPLELSEYETSRALAITPEAGRFVLGTEWFVRAYDRGGKERWKVPSPAVVWGVNVTGDGRLVVVALGDGTVRWMRLEDGRELLSLFVHAQDRRWIAWTPEGYYDSSERGDELIGWHQNRGWAEAAEFTFAYQRRDELKRPDRVRRALEGTGAVNPSRTQRK